MKNTTVTLLVASICSVTVISVQAHADEACFKVVTHSDNGATELELRDVSRMLLKQTSKWPDGTVVRPVDQAADSAVREAFSDAVHGRSATSIKRYWQRQIFSGNDVPPPEVADDRAVLDHVRSQPGAIGYVGCAHTGAPGVTTFDLDERGTNPVLLVSTRGLLWLDDRAGDTFAASIPIAIELARTLSSRGEVRIVHAGRCGTGGRRVFLHNRDPEAVEVEVEHSITDEGRPRFRRVETYRLTSGGRRHLGCSIDGGVEHAFTFGGER